MGKKTPAATQFVPAPAPAPKTKSAAGPSAPPPAAVPHLDLTTASELLDNVSADALFAFMQAKFPNYKPVSCDDDDFDAAVRTPKEMLASLRSDVQANDASKLVAGHEQKEQLLEGCLMIADAAIDSIEPKNGKDRFHLTCWKMMHNRLKCFSAALKKVGPITGGSFNAAYELWHLRRRYFGQPDFKPDIFEKTDVDDALAKAKTPEPPKDKNEDGGTKTAPRRDNFRSFRGNDRYRPQHRRQNKDRSRSRSPKRS